MELLRAGVWFRLLALCLCACSGSALATSFQCSLVPIPVATAPGTGGATAIFPDGRLVNMPTDIVDCRGIRITDGTVLACTRTRRGQLTCQRIGKGETIIGKHLAKTGQTRDWKLALLDLITGGETHAQAISRGAGDTLRYLPEGKVLMFGERLVLDFAASEMRDIQAVEFREDSPSGNLISRVPGIGRRTLTTALFRPGKTYWWVAESQVPRIRNIGKFFVADVKEMAHVRNETKRMISQPDQVARGVALSDWLYERGFHYDAAQALIEAGVLAPDRQKN